MSGRQYGSPMVRQIAAAYDRGFRNGFQNADHNAPSHFTPIEIEAFNYGYATAVWRREGGGASMDVH